jgi:hypothetical protein
MATNYDTLATTFVATVDRDIERGASNATASLLRFAETVVSDKVNVSKLAVALKRNYGASLQMSAESYGKRVSEAVSIVKRCEGSATKALVAIDAWNADRQDEGKRVVYSLQTISQDCFGIGKVAPKVKTTPAAEGLDVPAPTALPEVGKGDLVDVILANLAHVKDEADLDRIMLAVGMRYDALRGKVLTAA